VAQNASISALAVAAEDRSVLTRRKVEEAISAMQAGGDTITFKTVAERSGVSRQYLYEHFRDTIDQLRDKTRTQTIDIGGEEVAVRSSGRAAAVELALRNKIARLETDATELRKELNLYKRRYEKSLGEAEEWRNRHKAAVADLLDAKARLRRGE